MSAYGSEISALFASFGSSIESFFEAAGEFFSHLAAVHWGTLFLALTFFGLHLTARTRAWFNVLRAAYPQGKFRWRRIFGAYVAGVGINSVTPLHGGDVVKVYLAKQSIPRSTYVTIAASFFVESIFDTAIGSLVLLFALSQGVLPGFIQLPDLSAFDLSYWASHPRLVLLVITILFVVSAVGFALLARRVQGFWQHIKQGWLILRDRKRYLREVVLFQALGWLLKTSAFYFFLQAFGIAATVRNAILVMSVQALSTLMPFTPGGAGAQQALLVYIFRGLAAKTAILSYSIGQQVSIAVFNVLLGFSALFLMARTLDWKVLRKKAEQEKSREKATKQGPREPHAPK